MVMLGTRGSSLRSQWFEPLAAQLMRYPATEPLIGTLLGLRDFFQRSAASVRTEPRVEFLGEQDGIPEGELKALLVETLKGFPSVAHAYLARVGFQPADHRSVALCLVAGQPNPRIVREVRTQFRALFAKNAFVDIIFLSDDQQADVARVCPAFYSRTQ